MPRVATLSKMSSFQQHKNYEIKNKQESVTHAQDKEQRLETYLEGAQLLDLK